MRLLMRCCPDFWLLLNALPPAASDLQKDRKHFQKYPFSRGSLGRLLSSAIRDKEVDSSLSMTAGVGPVFLRDSSLHQPSVWDGWAWGGALLSMGCKRGQSSKGGSSIISSCNPFGRDVTCSTSYVRLYEYSSKTI